MDGNMKNHPTSTLKSDPSTTCGDTVICKGEHVCCSLEKGHPVVGFNNGLSRKYQFHQGDGWVWDERCAWLKGQEPQKG